MALLGNKFETALIPGLKADAGVHQGHERRKTSAGFADGLSDESLDFGGR
jgi:hypothetical protein